MKNKMEDLRNHLFETLEMVKDGKMDVAQARAMSEVGRTIIGTAKLELEYIEKVDSRFDTGFIRRDEPQTLSHGNVRQLGKRSA